MSACGAGGGENDGRIRAFSHFAAQRESVFSSMSVQDDGVDLDLIHDFQGFFAIGSDIGLPGAFEKVTLHISDFRFIFYNQYFDHCVLPLPAGSQKLIASHCC